MRMFVACVALTVALAGCDKLSGFKASGASEGSEQAARDFYDAEFKKWLAGQAAVIKPISMVTAIPLSYSIQSVVPVTNDNLAILNPPPGSGDWPCYKFNVEIQAKTVNNSKTSKIASCTLTWHKNDKRWCYFERF